MLSEILKIKAFIIAKGGVKIYVGCINLKWKECVKMDKDKKIKTILFEEQFKDTSGDTNPELNEMLIGEL